MWSSVRRMERGDGVWSSVGRMERGGMEVLVAKKVVGWQVGK